MPEKYRHLVVTLVHQQSTSGTVEGMQTCAWTPLADQVPLSARHRDYAMAWLGSEEQCAQAVQGCCVPGPNVLVP
jgi:hypothetical protein